TERKGPDQSPAVSPDGKFIAYTGFDDKEQGYQVTRLYVMKRDGTSSRLISGDLDRDVEEPKWSQDGGGVSPGRPYSSGSFSVSHDGRFAYTQSRPEYPADVAVGRKGAGAVKRVTRLNDDLFGLKQLGATEPIGFESSFDKRKVQGWVVKPPGFDAQKKYPLI